jgi:hypothetical protein
VLDMAARHGRKLESVPAEIVGEILMKVATLLD